LKAEAELLHPVHLDLVESSSTFVIHAAMPGCKANDIEVNVEPNRVTSLAKCQTTDGLKGGKAIYSERTADQMLRILDLPTPVDPVEVTTTLKEGSSRDRHVQGNCYQKTVPRAKEA
jgi:HSP20 family molecular chaperone IbpA